MLTTDPGGIPRDIRDEVWANQDMYIGGIIETKCGGISHDSSGAYSLMHPVFEKLRDDKNTCDDFNAIQEIENMVKGLSND